MADTPHGPDPDQETKTSQAADTAADGTRGPSKGLATKKRHWYNSLPRWVYPLAAVTSVAAIGLAVEDQTSFFSSRFFRGIAEGKTFTETRSSGPASAPYAAGPYDDRLGYTHELQFRQALDKYGFVPTGETTWQEHKVFGLRLFPIYNEKSQAGLKIADDASVTIYAPVYPNQAYGSFEAIPPLVVNSLLFVENRELMGTHFSTKNPAIEWNRLANAVLGQGLKKAHLGGGHAGGSTLATQIEKFRHSPHGVTASASEKMRQMLTASTRAYEDGFDTLELRHRIVVDYLNSMPLSSYPRFGEVSGYADGMKLWFGRDFTEANRLLTQPQDTMSDDQLRDAAKVYRQSLGLVMAVKAPSDYLLENRASLDDRIDKFLPKLTEAGIITPRFAQMIRSVPTEFADPARPLRLEQPPTEKAVSSLELDLLKALGVHRLYDLNRLDVTAHTTVDGQADAAVAATLKSLADPDVAAKSGLTGYQLLKPEAVGDLVYSFMLYEKTTDGRNVLRVETDNFDGPLNLNEGTKLELGSTAKLRTLVSYLEAVTDLHDRYAGKDAATLGTIAVSKDDHITRWALDYLSKPENDQSLNAMLEASLDREYSGNPGERFFTGGGVHHFENFESNENGRSFTVKDAFHHSVNLSFVRILRDVVNYTLSEKMHVDPTLYDDPSNPERQEYLNKFADAEGTGFMWKFWGDLKEKSPEDLAAALAAKTHRSPAQLAVVYRSLFPDAPYEAMEGFIRKECPSCAPDTDFHKTYESYGRDKFDLNDRGYITHIHPLELWLAQYRVEHPDTTWKEAVAASAETRLETYKWLFKEGKEHAQNLRIQTMLEKEAFTYIHADWKNLGYPFATLVPSYASALGASGDTPAALAQLSGIIQNDGVLKPAIKFSDIQLAAGTPYAMDYHPKEGAERRVLPAELTKLVRREMQGVVEEGTAKRALGSVTLSDGRVLPVGGKTGTGDNRLQTFSAHGAVTSKQAKSRTATFVYAIDDRFYGCVTAYVAGPHAGDYKFTSALAAQVFKTLVPAIRPVLDKAYGVPPGTTPPVVKKDAVAKDKKPAAVQNPAALKPAVPAATPGLKPAA